MHGGDRGASLDKSHLALFRFGSQLYAMGSRSVQLRSFMFLWHLFGYFRAMHDTAGSASLAPCGTTCPGWRSAAESSRRSQNDALLRHHPPVGLGPGNGQCERARELVSGDDGFVRSSLIVIECLYILTELKAAFNDDVGLETYLPT